MKKVGIITFHAANNFGAVLQCYALQQTIKRLGFDVEIIDYRPKAITTGYKAMIRHPISLIKAKGINQALKRIFNFVLMARICLRNYRFYMFRKCNLNTSKNVFYNKESLRTDPPQYDIYIVGSDQVWNPYITHGLDSSFFLDFARKDKVKIGYGVSIGQTKDINEIFKCQIKEHIGHMNFISSREKTAAIFLEKLINKEVYNVLDPTLLLDSYSWDKCVEYTKVKNKYLLLYNLQPNKHMIDFANRISKKYDLDVICFNKNEANNAYNTFAYNNPNKFLGYIKNSEIIITNSFHGAVFSIIFHKPFYTFVHDTRGERMVDLMEELGLQDRIIRKDIDEINFNIDYEEIDRILSIKRIESLEFLVKALEI